MATVVTVTDCQATEHRGFRVRTFVGGSPSTPMNFRQYAVRLQGSDGGVVAWGSRDGDGL